MAKLVPPERHGQCDVDWECIAKEHMLNEQLHPAVGQVPAPDVLKQDLATNALDQGIYTYRERQLQSTIRI